jgi:small-conductance mechanosensitive channel
LRTFCRHRKPASGKKQNMPPAKSSKSGGLRVGIIRAISTPLGFYVHSLLIVEATLGLVLTASKLSEEHVWIGFFVVIALFLIVFIIVTGLVIWTPKICFLERKNIPNLNSKNLLCEIKSKT